MKISALFVYPVKSLKGIQCDSVRVYHRGFEHDRRWMIADVNNRCLTQRDHPELTCLNVSMTDESIDLEAPDGTQTRLPMQLSRGQQTTIQIWNDTVVGLEGPPGASGWISDYLGREATFIFMPDDSRRQVDLNYGDEGDYVSFADGYPVLLTSESSLAAFNERLASPLEMKRFRPNMVIAGTSPWSEDNWVRVSTEELAFRVVKPCGRCVVITTDQNTGVRDKEPLRELASSHLVAGKACFGMNLIPERTGELKVGQELLSV